MADISKELKAIEDAVYGEEVRGSIHDAIDKINKVVDSNEAIVTTANTTATEAKTAAENAEAIAEISFGNAITSQVSPVTGFVKGEPYFNNVTNDLWKCNGIGWDLVGNLKGAKGDQGTAAPSITGIALTSKVGLVSTYTISLSDGSNYTFQVSDGQSGSGSGDMMKADYDKNNNGVVDAAETVVSGTKLAQAAVLVEFAETSNRLTYKGQNVDGDMKAVEYTDKFSVQLLMNVSGSTATLTDTTYIGGTNDYLLTVYCTDGNRYIKSQNISGNTITIEFDDVLTGQTVVLEALKRGV